MSINLPTTIELVSRNVAIFASKLAQTIPLLNKAFIRVLSVALAMTETEIGKKVTSDAKDNLALTASREGLEKIGGDQGIQANPAEAAVLTGTIPSETGKTLPATVSFVGDANGVRYFPDNSFAEAGGVITATVTADELGIVGNLDVGQTLTISSQIAGIGTVMTITVVDNIGADEEETENYRQTVLTNQRTLKGGGNSADYRRWSESVSGVLNAFPYSKLPWDEVGYPGVPPERTVYIEATTDIDSDGIPPQSLLDEVRAVIEINPDTGIANQPLGITDDTLYVEPIFRTTLYIQITGLVVPAAQEASVKSQIEDGVESYLRAIKQFIVGLDFEDDKNNTVTNVSLSDLVQGIISDVGGSAEKVEFGTTLGVYTVTTYTTNEGETLKSGGVVYV
jgi:uncharacterized phage protein gp47/JayE